MSAARSDFQNSSPAGGIWHSLNRVLFALISAVLLVTLAYRMLPEVTKRKEQQARVDELRALVAKEKETLKRNLREENLLKHDSEYVGLIARDRLDLMREGETIYRLESKR